MTAALVVPAQRGGAHRDSIIAAAAGLTASSGWASVTMARLADEVGVSRQTVYNEVGSKSALAEAMVLAELGHFLDVVGHAFDEADGDPVEAIRRATRGVLELARDNALLRAIVSASSGADTELLPLLTTQSGSVLTTATVVLADRLAPMVGPVDRRELTVVVDVVVRQVLSHVMQPSTAPTRAADDIAWTAGRLLA